MTYGFPKVDLLITQTFEFISWFFFVFVFFFLFVLSRAAPTAYGGSQARGPIRAVAAGYSRSKLRLRPTPQLMAVPDP